MELEIAGFSLKIQSDRMNFERDITKIMERLISPGTPVITVFIVR